MVAKFIPMISYNKTYLFYRESIDINNIMRVIIIDSAMFSDRCSIEMIITMVQGNNKNNHKMYSVDGK